MIGVQCEAGVYTTLIPKLFEICSRHILIKDYLQAFFPFLYRTKLESVSNEVPINKKGIIADTQSLNVYVQ